MLKEFFGEDVEQALRKARQATGQDVLEYRVVDDLVVTAGKKNRVAVVVEVAEQRDDSPQQDGELGLLSPGEQAARRKGGREWARAFCQGVMKRMGFNVEVTTNDLDGFVMLGFEMPTAARSLQAGVWREFRGALQHLINRTVGENKEDEQRYLLDIGGSLEKRRRSIKRLAEYLVEKVPELGRSLEIHLMDSQDRRLLHTGLRDHIGIETGASGNKRYRLMKIGPARRKDGQR